MISHCDTKAVAFTSFICKDLKNLSSDKLLKFKDVQPSDDRVTSQGSRAAVKTLDKRKRHEIGTFFWSTFRVTA